MAGNRWVTAMAVAVAGLLITTTAPVGAAPVAVAAGAAAPAGTPVWASYQGSRIELASGWHGAQSCVVFSGADVRCFASGTEADRMLGYSRASDPLAALAPAATPTCASGWLCLYEFVNGGGRRLQFHDEYWNYLSNYGFDRQTSSWRNNQGRSDKGALSFYNRSTQYTCAANTYVASLGSYDNQAYAVWG